METATAARALVLRRACNTTIGSSQMAKVLGIRRGTAVIVLLSAVAWAAGASDVRAQSVKEFYSGRQIKFVVGSAGGGGYEFYSRLLGRYMSRHLPGNPLFVMQSMPGAAGMISANYLYNIAPRDGSELGMVGRAVGTQPLLDPKDPG